MRRTIKTELGTKELDKVIRQLEKFEELRNKMAKNMVEDLSKFSSKKMKNIRNRSTFKSSSPISFRIDGSDFKKTVSMIGEQVLYEEFGTGTQGAMNPHPIKDEFALNEYNSGKTIRMNKSKSSEASKHGIPEGTLYWTYKNGKGEKVYTQGIPAIKAGYDSYQATVKHIPVVTKKRLSEIIDEVAK